MSFRRILKSLLMKYKMMKYVVAPRVTSKNRGGSVSANLGALGSINVLERRSIAAIISEAAMYGDAVFSFGL